jgi:hypothetical protein
MTPDRHGIDRKGWFRHGLPVQRLLAVLAAVCAVLTPIPLPAQDTGSGGSYITPFPDNDVYRLQVFGDSIAEGLLAGIVETFSGDTRLQVQRPRHTLGGVLRNEFIDEIQTIDSNLSRTPMHVVLVMVGVYDRYPWRPPNANRRVAVGSDEWKAEYSRRVDRLMKVFKARNAALYWVGLPVMRRPEFSDDAQMINEIVRERAYVNGQKFIDVFSQFADENGAFNAYGPEVDGKIRLLREADGIHFTTVGNRKLAHFVEREVRRDLTQARSDRAVPLAGTELEQKRVRQMRTQADANAAPKNSPTPAAKDAKSQVLAGQATAAKGAARTASADAASGEVRADNGRITVKVASAGGKEETLAIDILRPALPASVVVAVTRRESPDRASQVGDSITSEISGGLTIVSSVSTSAEGASADRRRLPPTQTPYYRVLVKGEQLQPKPGRADDFSWPRPEAPAVDPAMLEQLANPSSSIRLAPAKSRRSATPNG